MTDDMDAMIDRMIALIGELIANEGYFRWNDPRLAPLSQLIQVNSRNTESGVRIFLTSEHLNEEQLRRIESAIKRFVDDHFARRKRESAV